MKELATLEDLKALGYVEGDISLPTFDEALTPSPLLSDSIYIEAIEKSPLIQLAKAEVQLSEINVLLARGERMPGFTVGYRHAYEDKSHFNGLSIAMDIPLWKASKNMAAAYSRNLSAAFAKEAKLTEYKARLNFLLSTLHSLNNRIKQLWPVIENTNNQRLIKKAFEGGQISLVEYLQESEYFLNAGLLLVSLRCEKAKTLLNLNTLCSIINE